MRVSARIHCYSIPNVTKVNVRQKKKKKKPTLETVTRLPVTRSLAACLRLEWSEF